MVLTQRILISNPDNIGDVVLRQPMYAALRAAGHELCLAVRAFVEPITPFVAPGATVLSFESNPYSPAFDPDSADVRRALDAAREFAPDVFCIAPYQHTVFDELLAESLEGCRTVGMAGILYAGDIHAGLQERSRIRLDREVSVSIDQHEAEKNERLCAELLGRPLRLPDPTIEADPRHLDDARSVIARLGLSAGQFWVANVGQNQYTAVKNWSLANWAKVLSHAVSRHGQQILLLGTPDEHDASEEVRSLMGLAGDAVANLCAAPSPLPTTIGMMQLSAGYIGRDTGPMHLAAALGKPVIAVFGGGNWPRFTPRPKAGFVGSVIMPCAGCNWVCHLEEPYCVRRVPVESVIEAFDAIRAGSIKSLTIRHFQIDAMLSARSIRQSADTCHDFMRRAAAAERRLRELREEVSQRDAAELQRVREAAEVDRTELQRVHAELAELAGKVAETRDELTRTQTSLHRAMDEWASVKAQRDDMESQLLVERSKVDLLKIDLAKTREQAETEKQGLMDVLNDLVTQHDELRQEGEGHRQRLQEREQSLAESRKSLEATRQELVDYQRWLQQSEDSLREHRQSISFRFLIKAGRPVVAVQRLLRSLFSGG